MNSCGVCHKKITKGKEYYGCGKKLCSVKCFREAQKTYEYKNTGGNDPTRA